VNFQKVLLIAVPLALLICAWMYFTRIDRTNPVAVGTAFTKAMKAGDTSKASGYWVPDKAEAWRTNADTSIDKMKTGATKGFFDSIPDDPRFAAGTPAVGGNMILTSADKGFTLELSQVAGKWYVSKGPI